MSILWTAPLALAGLALVAIPIAIHLLIRQQVRTLPYPSLRFLHETRLAAFRRRRVEDAVVLVCRIAVVAIAAAALAGPVVQTDARTAGYASRTSRAVVVLGAVSPDVMARLTDRAFRSTTVQREAIADALAEAVRWLNDQPRSAREIVIAGALRRGDIGPGDLAALPAGVGVHFEQTVPDGPGDLTVSILARRDNALHRIERSATLTAESTRVADAASSPLDADLVTIRSAPRQAELAGAALRAALAAGVPWHDFRRRVVVVWEGADGSSVTSPGSDVQVIRMPVPAPPSAAAGAVHAALAKASRPEWVEPLTIPRSQLESWTRRPGPPAVDAPTEDEGDRRWLWAAALALLAVEWRLRRPPSRLARFGGQPSPGSPTEAHANVSERERRLEARVA